MSWGAEAEREEALAADRRYVGVGVSGDIQPSSCRWLLFIVVCSFVGCCFSVSPFYRTFVRCITFELLRESCLSSGA